MNKNMRKRSNPEKDIYHFKEEESSMKIQCVALFIVLLKEIKQKDAGSLQQKDEIINLSAFVKTIMLVLTINIF